MTSAVSPEEWKRRERHQRECESRTGEEALAFLRQHADGGAVEIRDTMGTAQRTLAEVRYVHLGIKRGLSCHVDALDDGRAHAIHTAAKHLAANLAMRLRGEAP